MIIRYIKKVIFQWWILLGITPEILDKVSTYYGYELEIPRELTYFFILAFLFISTYMVWKEEKVKNSELEEKYKNPIDYDITAYLYPLDLEQDDILKNEYKILNEKKDVIKNIEKELLSIDADDEEDNLKHKNLSEMFGLINGKQKIKHNKSYKERFEMYINSYSSYIKDYEVYIKNLEKYYQTLDSKVYYVKYAIENVGVSSDEEIHIYIELEDGKFKKYEELFSNSPAIPNEPQKPQLVEYACRNLFISASSRNNMDFPLFDNEKFFRRFYELKEKSVTVQLKKLKVGDNVFIFDDKFFLFTDNYNKMKFEIKSKNSTKIIKKDIPVEIKKNLTHDDIFSNNKTIDTN